MSTDMAPFNAPSPKRRGRPSKGTPDPTISELLALDAVDEKKLKEGYFFERCYLYLLLKLAREKYGMGIREIAEKAFADKVEAASAIRMIYAMRGTTATGKPQRLCLREAFELAKVVERDFPDFTYRVFYFMESLEEYQAFVEKRQQ